MRHILSSLSNFSRINKRVICFSGVPEEPVKITSIKINPDPPEAGKNLTVTVGANVLERIEVCHRL